MDKVRGTDLRLSLSNGFGRDFRRLGASSDPGISVIFCGSAAAGRDSLKQVGFWVGTACDRVRATGRDGSYRFALFGSSVALVPKSILESPGAAQCETEPVSPLPRGAAE